MILNFYNLPFQTLLSQNFYSFSNWFRIESWFKIEASDVTFIQYVSLKPYISIKKANLNGSSKSKNFLGRKVSALSKNILQYCPH